MTRKVKDGERRRARRADDPLVKAVMADGEQKEAKSPAPSPEDRIAAIVRDAPLVAGPGVSPRPSGGGREDAPEPDVAREPRPLGFDVERMNAEWAIVMMSPKTVVVHEQPDGPIGDRVRVLSVDAFRQWYHNKPTEYVASDGKIKVVSWGDAWLRSRARRQYKGLLFQPDPHIIPDVAGYLNLWRGFAVSPREKKDGYITFRDHLRTNVCNGNEDLFRWVFGWFAHLVQRPRERIGTALVLRGKMGTGKSKVGEVVGSLFPYHFFMVDDARYVTGQFNAHMASCLLLQAEEAVWAGDKSAEGRLKSLVTSKFQMIEAKGVDPMRIDNYVRLMMTSNEDWVVPAGKDERRFCVIDVMSYSAQNTEYFAEIDQQLDDGGREALLFDLLAFDLDSVNLRQIPRTDALLEQKIRSLDSVESWWFERLSSGTTTRSGDQWLAQIAKSVLIDDYLASAERVGIRRKAEEAVFGSKLRRLVPTLAEARIKQAADDTSVTRRVWCYLLPSLNDCRDYFEEELRQAVPWSHPGD